MWKSGRSTAPEVPICELVDFEGFLLRCCFDPKQEARMVKPVFRRKSIGTKVSEEEYARLEALGELGDRRDLFC